ncbi:hypothetical protein V3565_01600 [Bartonella sp. B10]
MFKILKNNVLAIFISITFFLSQIINVNANYSKNNTHQSDILALVMEQSSNKAKNIDTLYVPNLDYGVENEAAIEGKIEKVFEPITIGIFSTMGAFGTGFLTGSVMAAVSALIGWAIGIIKKAQSK